MSVRYEDALQQVLDALQTGSSLEAAIARFPEHAAALREDVRLATGVHGLSAAVPPPRADARVRAAERMQAQLASERAEQGKPAWRPGKTAWVRTAAAAAVVAIAVLSAGLLFESGGSSVEASTIEGVVVGNQDGRLAVQTLAALEEVWVPAGIPISDAAGVAIGLEGIEAGQVVVIQLERSGEGPVAERVRRDLESLEAWCSGEPSRCAALAVGLEQTERRCERQACRIAVSRLAELRLRAGESVDLEERRVGCQAGAPEACERLLNFCREHGVTCSRIAEPGRPLGGGETSGERLRQLRESCLLGNETACRQLARACEAFPQLCPDGSPQPGRPLAP